MMADLLVSGGIVAALEQAAVVIGRLDAALAGNPLRRAWAFWSELDAARQNRSSRLSPTAPNRARRALVARTVVRPGVTRLDPLSLTSGRLKRLQALPKWTGTRKLDPDTWFVQNESEFARRLPTRKLG